MLGCWDVGMLGCRDVGMLGCWDLGQVLGQVDIFVGATGLPGRTLDKYGRVAAAH